MTTERKLQALRDRLDNTNTTSFCLNNDSVHKGPDTNLSPLILYAFLEPNVSGHLVLPNFDSNPS
jgi:hypothetical protein